jgi:hypothetical protein
MAKIEDRHRRFVTGGEPVATGVVALADSWACTNPSLGRGITMALLHALALRDLLRENKDEPGSFARAFDEATSATVEPWYRATLDFDRHRLAEMGCAIKGETYRPDDPFWDIGEGLQYAAGQDPDCFRAFLSIVGMLALPTEAVGRAGVLDTVMELGGQRHEVAPLGPSRDELLAMVAR